MAEKDNTNKTVGSVEEQKLVTGASVFFIEQNANMKVGQYVSLVIDGKFTVQVKKEKEGYVVDVLSEDNSRDDDVIETMTIWNDDLEAEA